MEGVKRSDIEAKHEKELGYPCGSEELDLYLLETLVKAYKPYYSPSVKTLSMVVGALGEKAVRVIKRFHEKSYGIPHRNNKVIACNTRELSNAEPFMDDYDVALSGSQGDATQESTWAYPFLHSGEEMGKYDFSFVRNPGLKGSNRRNIDNWASAF